MYCFFSSPLESGHSHLHLHLWLPHDSPQQKKGGQSMFASSIGEIGSASQRTEKIIVSLDKVLFCWFEEYGIRYVISFILHSTFSGHLIHRPILIQS